VRLLIAEDDREVAVLLERVLRHDGHTVDVVGTGAEALWLAAEVQYDAILLDVNLPPPDGFEVCRRLRTADVWAPVLFLSGRGRVEDRVRGLDAGGDDYLVKPVSLDELRARLRAVARRGMPARPTVLRAGDVEVDPAAHQATRAGSKLALSPKEFALLEMLARHAGEVVHRTAIAQELWDFGFDPSSNLLDVVVRRLREKIDRPFGRASIETVRGVGYRLSTGD
jgi:two-component system OmpR family response regulator